MADFLDETEYKLKEKQLDYTIVYAFKDYDRANNIHKQLKNWGFDGRLYNDEETPFEDWFIENKLGSIQDLLERSTHILFCVSNNFQDSDDGDEFLLHKGEIIMNWLREKRQKRRIIPVYLDNKKDITDTTYSYLYGLASFNGFHPKSKYFKEDVEKQFNCQQSKKLKEQRALENAKKLEEYRAEKEQRRKQDEEEKQQSDSQSHSVVPGF